MSIDDDASSIKRIFVGIRTDADTVLATTRFISAISKVETVELPRRGEVAGVMKEFCLDIDKLEAVASARNRGLACSVRCPKGFVKGTYFLLRAEFVDNTSWDIIIPHPDSILTQKPRNFGTSRSPRTSLEQSKHPPRMPKLIHRSLSPANEAGVVFIFIKNVSGNVFFGIF